MKSKVLIPEQVTKAASTPLPAAIPQKAECPELPQAGLEAGGGLADLALPHWSGQRAPSAWRSWEELPMTLEMKCFGKTQQPRARLEGK